jgi:hypothetical protein
MNLKCRQWLNHCQEFIIGNIINYNNTFNIYLKLLLKVRKKRKKHINKKNAFNKTESECTNGVDEYNYCSEASFM